ncbi:MAG TPA: argininosuccinate lyase [Elusimicrobiota bacterium]|nr:argininosuccinate lyase [Elusimicrobiota bacterium]
MTKPEEFIGSIEFDHRLAPFDLRASIVHARMLVRQGIIAPSAGRKIVAGLTGLLKDVEKGKRIPPAEDIHFAIEKALFRRIGPVAGWLHTARSRNDQVVTAFRMYVRDRIDHIDGLLCRLERVFLVSAEKQMGVVMPGHTHLQPAQPILLSHLLMAYAWMFQRDRERLVDVRKRVNVLPLGAAALAGTSFPIDPAWVARQLGFGRILDNSLDAVSDRDFTVEFLSALSLIMMHVSRWAEELVIGSNPNLDFVWIADPFVSGSSIMPQKRNPDVAELMRGKTGRVYGDLMAMLTLLKAQPLAYNRDMQEDKPPVFDAVDLVESVLDVCIPMVETLRWNAEKLADACRHGFLSATDVADELVRRGLPFRQSHGLVAGVVAYARERGLSLEDVPLPVWKKQSPRFDRWIYDVLSVSKAASHRTSPGGTSPVRVKEQIRRLKRMI